VKSVKGGRRVAQGHLASTLAAPKVTVRTTKATELRAKKTLQQGPTTKNGQNGLRAPSVGNSRSRSMSPAMNSGVFVLTPRKATDLSVGKTSPSSNRFRHYSSSSGRNDGVSSPLTIAKDTQKIEDQMRKSPNIGRQQPCANAKPKRELGSNVKRKIESLSLQKRESASEDDTPSPLMYRKAKNTVSAGERSSKSPQAAAKSQGENRDPGSHSNKGQDGKRALVTTV